MDAAAPRALTGHCSPPSSQETSRGGADRALTTAAQQAPRGCHRGWGSHRDAMSPSSALLHSATDPLSHLISIKTLKFKTKAHIKAARRNRSDPGTRSPLLSC